MTILPDVGTSPRPKDPAKVAAGKARHAQLRAQLGPAGYQAWQQHAHAAAVAAHPDLHQRAARAANVAQLRCWGEELYREQRRAAYRAGVATHGATRMQQRIVQAHRARRAARLAHPTTSETALHDLLTDLGIIFRSVPDDWNFTRSPDSADHLPFGEYHAVREAPVGPFFVDVLIPRRALALEVYGGVHCFLTERDARRTAALEAAGLQVVVVWDVAFHDPDSVRQHCIELLTGGADVS